MISVILALVLPALYWEQGPETSSTLREAGVEFDVVPELVETPTRPLADGRGGIAAIAGNLRGLPVAVRQVRALAERYGSQILYSHNTWSHYVSAFAVRSAQHVRP